jgi:aldehyde:ferredoxin oxidoreductase
MRGWNGRLLRVDLSRDKTIVEEYPADLAMRFIGGRGFAIKLLWDELPPGADPLGPENLIIFAAGPLTGFPIPSSGKLVVASKSPLTGGYGDGNVGTRASVQLRRCGLDAMVISGRAERPSYLLVEDDRAEIRDASDLWGLDAFEAEERLLKEYGKEAGILLIGPAGENRVRFAVVVSQRGRAGGRPGMGAIMGSKNLKAVVLKGSRELEAADPSGLRELGREAYRVITEKENYDFWRRQGTMATIEWCQENSTLPTYNFKEGVFDEADAISGSTMEKMVVKQRGCPQCNMICGNIIEDCENLESELDYENVAMLGADIGLGDLKRVAVLNRMCDELGLDTISTGNVLGFAIEAAEKGVLDIDITWGDFEGARRLMEDITYRRGEVGELLSLGVREAAERLGGAAPDFAIHVKGLECSAYDCHLCPGMALSFGTSPIGAHHKDAWVISWEIASGRRADYIPEKADKVIEFQRIRGGMFECLVTCRFPWIELGFELDWYPRFFKAATGVSLSLEEMFTLGDRVYALIRAFWVREYGGHWGREMDYPPRRWFDEPLTKGSLKGAHLEREGYDRLLQTYYNKRGWDDRGIPTKETFKRLGLESEAQELESLIELR